MNRRDFLTKGLAALGSGLVLGRSVNAFALGREATPLSLQIITDKPDLAIAHLQRLAGNLAEPGRLIFSEYSLPGRHLADLVVVRNNQLVNYKTGKDDFSQQLRSVAKSMNLPRAIENPVLVKLASASRQQATAVEVYRNNERVNSFAIDKNVSGVEIEGAKGGLVLSIENGHAGILETTCKHKTCLALGKIRRPGQALVCVPNQLRVVISGSAGSGIDSLVM